MLNKTLCKHGNCDRNSGPECMPGATASDDSRTKRDTGGNVFNWETQVLFGDIDFYGVVYYLKYFDWRTKAREVLIVSHHPDQIISICPSVLEVTHKFLRPAKLLDRIRIEVTFTGVKKTSVQMNFDIYRDDSNTKELLGTHQQKLLFLSREGKIMRMSPELFATLKHYERME